jgi:hypothetical protein
MDDKRKGYEKMTGTDDTKQAEAPSNLFLVRVRNITTGDGEEWCGRVQHVISGKAYTFHSLETLVDLMVAMQGPMGGTEEADGDGSHDSQGGEGRRWGGASTSYPPRHMGLCS